MGLASFNRMRREAAAKLAQSENNKADEKQEGQDYSQLKTDELKAILAEKGIEFDAKAKKADLLAFLQE
ncbi:HeH/LEM domain-containing protein [Moellerella wisconsensis]|uniref:HeH/LEM domain-containing protein n=1 Tax=Moellerella wisconsensis TaxID=158849 RepID=A0ACD3Y9Y6_9GAMM|nr:HeH/LEM domain-containing protein [Moellerella wisconsensis]UNH39972.1 HeH/LEM domain-containing protein [Moellerella wisconsensis]